MSRVVQGVMTPRKKRPAEAFNALDEHATDIGHVTLAWNHLHEALGDGQARKMASEIEWACNQMNGLEEHRNNVIHAPFTIGIEDGTLKVMPVISTGHTRALKLAGKDLKTELQW